ncbi:MAG: TraR/DksA C4-type zinc finger protein [Actinomycetota bacterium]|nr:TraR/DksA C4-type zinc finger protein [Actinomycetota bacterium]
MTSVTIIGQNASWTLGPRQVARLRRLLEQQRRFRSDQLAHLDQDRALRSPDAGVREVAESLLAGARLALHEVRDALRQMDAGQYGTCRDCHALLDADRLEALPQVTRCPACQRVAAR